MIQQGGKGAFILRPVTITISGEKIVVKRCLTCLYSKLPTVSIDNDFSPDIVIVIGHSVNGMPLKALVQAGLVVISGGHKQIQQTISIGLDPPSSFFSRHLVELIYITNIPSGSATYNLCVALNTYRI